MVMSNFDARVAALEARVEELTGALEKIAQIQRDKCENASAEILFMLLDNKVGIARAALSARAVNTALATDCEGGTGGVTKW